MPVEAVQGLDGKWTLYERGGLRATAREFDTATAALNWATAQGWKLA